MPCIASPTDPPDLLKSLALANFSQILLSWQLHLCTRLMFQIFITTPYIHCQLTRPLNRQRVGHHPFGELGTTQIKELKQQTEHAVPHHRLRHSVGISSITDFFFHYTTPRNLWCMFRLSWLSLQSSLLLCLPPIWGRSKQVDTTSRLLITLESLKASGEVQVTRCQGWSHAAVWLLCLVLLQLLPSKPTLYKSQTPIHSPSPASYLAWLSSRLSQCRLVTSIPHPHCNVGTPTLSIPQYIAYIVELYCSQAQAKKQAFRLLTVPVCT